MRALKTNALADSEGGREALAIDTWREEGALPGHCSAENILTYSASGCAFS